MDGIAGGEDARRRGHVAGGGSAPAWLSDFRPVRPCGIHP